MCEKNPLLTGANRCVAVEMHKSFSRMFQCTVQFRRGEEKEEYKKRYFGLNSKEEERKIRKKVYTKAKS